MLLSRGEQLCSKKIDMAEECQVELKMGKMDTGRSLDLMMPSFLCSPKPVRSSQYSRTEAYSSQMTCPKSSYLRTS